MPDPESLQALAARIHAHEALGRSQLIQKLFDFLIECSATGRAPKEAEVAIEVFGKDMDFDVAQDAMVRVYVHKLRRKLEEYYSGPGRGEPNRLAIPKGAYRIVINDRDAAGAEAVEAAKVVAPVAEMPRDVLEAPPPPRSSRRWLWPTLGASVLINLLFLGVLLWHSPHRPDPVLRNPLWTRMLNSDRPLLVVLGDYYIFAETDQNMEVQRLVREFSINSPGDLDQYLKLHPDLADRYQDMQLNYLPTSSAYALKDLMPLLAGAAARTRVVMASAVTPAMLKSSDVIYIGYLSGMGMLSDLVFSGSRFDVGESFDVLIDRASGKRYMAVMHTAESVTHQDALQQLSARSGNARSFDALYDVFAMDGTNLNGTLVLTGKIDTTRIWADAAPPPTARLP
jgi:hypothetical protein